MRLDTQTCLDARFLHVSRAVAQQAPGKGSEAQETDKGCAHAAGDNQAAARRLRSRGASEAVHRVSPEAHATTSAKLEVLVKTGWQGQGRKNKARPKCSACEGNQVQRRPDPEWVVWWYLTDITWAWEADLFESERQGSAPTSDACKSLWGRSDKQRKTIELRLECRRRTTRFQHDWRRFLVIPHGGSSRVQN